MKKFICLLLCFVTISTLSYSQGKKKQSKTSQPASVPVPDSVFFNALQFRNVGPTRGGRVTTVAGTPMQHGTFYMGSSGGGVWKTTDYGVSWKNVSDGYFSTPSIGAIRVAPSNPEIVYVGTGSDGIRSNIIVGKGMYKSADGGKTWKSLGLEKVGQIGAVEVHPRNTEVVFVAAIGQPFQHNPDRGVFRSKDGGAHWEKVLYLSDSVGAVDLEFAPGNPDIIYAAMWRGQRKPWTIISGGEKTGGIYKSTDGGTTWTQTTEGLPKGLIGKIDLAVSSADPNRVYALVEAPKGEEGLYRSDDQAATFKRIGTHAGLMDRPFYYCNIEANPLNADVIFVMATNFFKSKDAGKTWKTIRPQHGDNHDMWINPMDTSIFIQSNDGGANITTNGGKTWSTEDNQPTSELYQIEVDDQYPYWLYAGQQDNYTAVSVPSLPPYGAPTMMSYLMDIGGCETGPAVPKPGNSNIIYTNCKGRFGVYDKRTGQERQYYVGAANIYGHDPDDLTYRFQRVSPIFVSPHNPNVVYHGSQYVHKTTNDGLSWETISPDLTAHEADKQVISGEPITRDVTGEEYYSTIYDINESRIKEGLIWVGANDGPVHVTQDGGKTWEHVTPQGLPPGGRVDCVEPSPHQASKAYVAVLRNQLGDWHPYIYRTNDMGKSWTLLTNGKNGIPEDQPTRTIREDPNTPGLLYAGTEFGFYVSFDDGLSWKSFQQNLPITPVTDIKIFRGDLILSTMGRSFWILDNISALYQLDPARKVSNAYLFKPDDAYRYHYRGTGKDNVPQYPAPGATIDYYLKAKPESDITLQILNSSGEVIRAFTSIVPKKDTTKANGDETGNLRNREAKADLSKTAGLHRFRWDLQHQGPWDKNPARSYRGGPTAKPATYTARLLVNGESFSQTFNVLADPRINQSRISPDDLVAQEALALQVRDLQDTSKRVAEKISMRKKELDKLIKAETDVTANAAELEKLKSMEAQLVTATGTYMTPMIIDQLDYLASMLDQADQRPGKDAYVRYAELKQRLDTVLRDFKDWEDAHPQSVD